MVILQPVPYPSGESRLEANRRFSSRPPSLLFLGAAFLALIFSCLCASARAGPDFEAGLERLEIVTATGPHVFQVEVARTEEQRSKGLMYRRALPEDHGMLFDFGVEDVVVMWMKNTPVSLDMIFVSSGGWVVSIAQDTVPLSEAFISSETPAFAVIEVSAGTARKIGLSVGDAVRLRHPMFKP